MVESQFHLDACAGYGKDLDSDSLVLKAKVIFINAVPKVVVVLFTNSAIQGSEGLFGKVIQPDAGADTPGSWPEDYPDITLTGGAIYYAKEKVTDHNDTSVTKRTYLPGYGVDAELILFEVRIGVFIQIYAKRAGVRIQTVLFGSLKWEFVKVTNLSLSIDTAQETKVGLLTRFHNYDVYGILF